MYDTRQLDELHDRLEDGVTRALAEGEYQSAARHAYTIDTVKKWQASGYEGPLPADAQELAGMELAPLPEEPPGLPDAPTPDEPTSFDLNLDALEPVSRVDQALEAQLERGKRSLSNGKFTEAIADFEAVAERAESSDLRASAQRYLKQAERSQYEKINQAIDKARKHGRSQRSDFKGRRAQWEAVLALDPDNQEATEAINEIETAEFEQNFRSIIVVLHKPLQARDKRITDVEAARNKAAALLAGGQVRAPALIAEAQGVYAKLDELRNQILLASESVLRAERRLEYEYAIEKLKKAILAGYVEIIDEYFGTPLDPLDALRRIRLAYFEDLKERAAKRYGDARASLKAGAPEAALRWLKEAEELMRKVEEGGEELHKQVKELMDWANAAIYQKQDDEEMFRSAAEMVLDAERCDDPYEARSLLVHARHLCPAYPDIDHLIEGKETLVLFKTISEVTQDLINADAALYTRRFSEARQHCNQALSRSRNLRTSNDELWAKQSEAFQMLEVIFEQEKNLAGLLNKLAEIDQSLERGDLRLAQRLFDLLTPEERNSPEGLERLARLQLAREDAQSGEVKRAEQETASPA